MVVIRALYGSLTSPCRSAVSVVRGVIASGSSFSATSGGGARGECPLEGGREVLGALDVLAERAEGAGEGGEVGVAEVGADDAAGEPPLLVHADRARSIPLSTTTTRTGRSYCMAVASSWPLIRKSPSPAKQTTGRSGSIAFAASAAGTP